MSFDLNFFKKSKNTVKQAEIFKFLNTIPMITNETENQCVYQNEDTGVYCLFDYYELDKSEEEDFEEEDFGDLEDTNISFNINYARPQFFGTESFEIAEKLVHKFDLYVLDPQAEGEPLKYQKGNLLKSWLTSNEKISKSYFKEWGLKYLELEKSNYSWDFCYSKNALQESLGEAYFVPNIFYINEKGTDSIKTLCVWPQHIPFVLPNVDFVLIQRKIRKLFRTKDESGLVKYASIVEKLGGYFKNESNYKIIHPNNSEKIASIFNEIEIYSSIEEFGESVSIDKIVNFKMEE